MSSSDDTKAFSPSKMDVRAELGWWISRLRRVDLDEAYELAEASADERMREELLHKCQQIGEQRERVVRQALYPLLHMHNATGVPVPVRFAEEMVDLSDMLLDDIEQATAEMHARVANERRPMDLVVGETQALLERYTLKESQTSALDVFILNGVDMSLQPESFLELMQRRGENQNGGADASLSTSLTSSSSSFAVGDALAGELERGEEDGEDDFGRLLRVLECRLEALRSLDQDYVARSGEALQEVQACFREVGVPQEQRNQFYSDFEACMEQRDLQRAVALCAAQLDALQEPLRAVEERKRRAVQGLLNEVGSATQGVALEMRALDRAGVVSAVKDWRALVADLQRREVELTRLACESTGELTRAVSMLRGVNSPVKPSVAVLSMEGLVEDDQCIAMHENDLNQARVATERAVEQVLALVLDYEMQYGQDSFQFDFRNVQDAEPAATDTLPFNRMFAEEEVLLNAQYAHVKQVVTEYRHILVEYRELLRIRDQYHRARKQRSSPSRGSSALPRALPHDSNNHTNHGSTEQQQQVHAERKTQSAKHSASSVRRPRRNVSRGNAPAAAAVGSLPGFSSSLKSPERSSPRKLVRKNTRDGHTAEALAQMREGAAALEQRKEAARRLTEKRMSVDYKHIERKSWTGVSSKIDASNPSSSSSSSSSYSARHPANEGQTFSSKRGYLPSSSIPEESSSSQAASQPLTDCVEDEEEGSFFESADGELFQVVDGEPVAVRDAASTPLHRRRPAFDAPGDLDVPASQSDVSLPSPLESSRFRERFKEQAEDPDLLNRTASPVAKADPLAHVPYANKRDARTGHLFDTPQQEDEDTSAGAQSHAQLTPVTAEDIHPRGDAFQRASARSPFSESLLSSPDGYEQQMAANRDTRKLRGLQEEEGEEGSERKPRQSSHKQQRSASREQRGVDTGQKQRSLGSNQKPPRSLEGDRKRQRVPGSDQKQSRGLASSHKKSRALESVQQQRRTKEEKSAVPKQSARAAVSARAGVPARVTSSARKQKKPLSAQRPSAVHAGESSPSNTRKMLVFGSQSQHEDSKAVVLPRAKQATTASPSKPKSAKTTAASSAKKTKQKTTARASAAKKPAPAESRQMEEKTTPRVAALKSPELIHVEEYADEVKQPSHERVTSLVGSSRERHLQCVNVELLPLPSAIEEEEMLATQRAMMQPLKSEFGNDTDKFQGYTTFAYKGKPITAALWRPKRLEYFSMSDDDAGDLLSYVY